MPKPEKRMASFTPKLHLSGYALKTDSSALLMPSFIERLIGTITRLYKAARAYGDRMIKQLLTSVIAKYRDLSLSRRSIVCLSLRLRQINNLLATDISR